MMKKISLLGFFLLVLPLLGKAMADEDTSRLRDSIITEPVLVLAHVVSVRQIDDVAGHDFLGATFEVRLNVVDVAAGLPTGLRDTGLITVRLVAGDRGYLNDSEDLIVLLDPKKIAEGQPLYWNRQTNFACVSKDLLDRMGLKMKSNRAFQFESEICIP